MQWASPVRIKRSELYQKLWSTPTTKIAKEIGVSDVALNKICTKHRIPKPPLGYWARLQHGKADKQIPLPELESAMDPVIEIRPRIKGEKAELPEDLRAITIDKISVPTERVRFHPLVVKTKGGFRGAHANEYGRLSPKIPDCLNITVGKDSIERALKIWDALIKALEKKDFKVQAVGGGSYPVRTGEPKTEVFIAGEWVEFRMEERSIRSDAPPQPKTHSWSYSPKWVYTPSGKLTVLIESYLGDGYKKSWSDRDKSLLEDDLGSIVSGLVEASASLRQRRIESERQAAAQKERQRLAYEAEQRRLRTEAINRDLEQKATRWRSSHDIMGLADEVEREAAVRGLSLEQLPRLAEWLRYARSHAAKVSPIDELFSLDPKS